MDLLTLRYVAQVRDHLVVREGDGVVTVTGGKWTTYRKMAEDAVDAAVAEGGADAAARLRHAAPAAGRGARVRGNTSFKLPCALTMLLSRDL